MRRTISAAALLLSAALATTAGAGRAASGEPQARKRASAARQKRRAAPAKTPAAARPEVREIDEAGLKALLEGHAGRGRLLLVNFWATWCLPCREEFPDLVRIEREFARLDGFEFVTVSLDDLSDIRTGVPDFLRQMRATRMPAFLLNASEPEAAINLVDPEWRGELPATFLFGPGGGVVYKHTGRVRAADLRKAIGEARARRDGGAPETAAPAPAASPKPEPTPAASPTPEPTPPVPPAPQG